MPIECRETLIAVVNWNNASDTIACLRSLEQEPEATVLVVDNGSTDDSVRQIRTACPWAEVLALPENRGYGAACNAAARMASDSGVRYIVFLNNDTVVSQGFSLHLAGVLKSSSITGIAVPRIRYFQYRDYIWYAGGIADITRGIVRHRGIRQRDDGRFDTLSPTGYATGCCMAVRCADFLDAGGFDESFGMYGEDVDFSLRMKNERRGILYVPAAVVFHKVSASSGGEIGVGKLLRKNRSMLRVMMRYGGGRSVLLYCLRLPFVFVSGMVRVKVFYLRQNLPGGRADG
ncbi:MAG: glycosyltransferase family 2 protein [Prosthecochloris sp.]|nr:glycosyltransferase family 2 protein [Prosthecochloris sp.]